MYASLLNQPNSLFGQFERLRRELDDVFGVAGLPSSIRSVTPGTLPAINVGRTPTSVEVYAFVPGLDASRIEVTLDRGVLRIAGERAAGIPANESKLQVYTRERGAGRFIPWRLPTARRADAALPSARGAQLPIDLGRHLRQHAAVGV